MAELSLTLSVPMPDGLDENDAELATAAAREVVRIVNEERKRNNSMNDQPVELLGVARWVATD